MARIQSQNSKLNPSNLRIDGIVTNQSGICLTIMLLLAFLFSTNNVVKAQTQQEDIEFKSITISALKNVFNKNYDGKNIGAILSANFILKNSFSLYYSGGGYMYYKDNKVTEMDMILTGGVFYEHNWSNDIIKHISGLELGIILKDAKKTICDLIILDH